MIYPGSRRLRLDSRVDHGGVEISGRGTISVDLQYEDLAILDAILEGLK